MFVFEQLLNSAVFPNGIPVGIFEDCLKNIPLSSAKFRLEKLENTKYVYVFELEGEDGVNNLFWFGCNYSRIPTGRNSVGKAAEFSYYLL